MKIFPLLLAVFFDVVLAQVDSSQLPRCAQSCAIEFASASGCELIDITCVCRSMNYIRRIACCLNPICDATDQYEAIKFAKDLCRSGGVELPFNDPITPACWELPSSTSSSTSTSKSLPTNLRTMTGSTITRRTSPIYPSPTRTSAQASTSLAGGGYYTSSSSSSSQSKPRLRVGGKIGIAIGVCVVFLLAAVGIKIARRD